MIQQLKKYGNTVGRQVPPKFEQLTEITNEIVKQNFKGTKEPLIVPIDMPTGSGKSVFSQVYSSLLWKANTPEIFCGVLIVVRTIEDANRRVAAINELASEEIAQARYTGHPNYKLTDLTHIPVLVVCHEALRRAIQKHNDYAFQDSWNVLFNYGEIDSDWQSRGLCIIDEALDITHHSEISKSDVDQIELYLKDALVDDRYKPERETLAAIKEAMRVYEDDRSSPKELIRVLEDSLPTFKKCTSVMRLADDLTLDTIKKEFRTLSKDVIQGLLSVVRYNLLAIDNLIHSWKLLTVRGQVQNAKSYLSTSDLLLPIANINYLVLDATANVNKTYKYLKTNKTINVPDFSDIRDYSTCSVTYSPSFNTGASVYVGDATVEERGQAIGSLKSFLKMMIDVFKDRENVLLISHKKITETLLPELLKDMKVPFKVNLAYFHNIDGRNDWADCDGVAIFGLPHIDKKITKTKYGGLKQGLTTFDITDKDSIQAVEELEHYEIISNLVQAMGRPRSRVVTTSDGKCEDVKFLITLNKNSRFNSLSREIRNNISKCLPNIQVNTDLPVELYSKEVVGLKTSFHLVHYLKHLNDDVNQVTFKEVAGDLKTTTRTLQRITSAPKGDLHEWLEIIGWSHVAGVKGSNEHSKKKPRAHFKRT